MNEILKILLSLSLSGSILILILFLFKPLFKWKMTRVWQYYIWLVVIARLLLPFAPENNLVGNLFQEYTFGQSVSSPEGYGLWGDSRGDRYSVSQLEISSAVSEDHFPGKAGNSLLLNLTQHLGLIWLMVALILLIRKITIYQSFIKYIRAGSTPVDDINLLEQLGKVLVETKIRGSVELYTNRLISTPLLTGFFRPCIVLPATECSNLDFQYTVRHELTHFKRKDMFYKWLMQITVCLHWFNPLVYLMARHVNHLCELSCDEVIIRNLDVSAMRDYGNTLLEAMKGNGIYKDSLSSVTLNESKELLKERLDTIMNYKKQSKIIKVLSFILTLTICIGGAFTGAYAGASDQSQDVVFDLTSNGQGSLMQSGGFMAEDNQTLTIKVQSDIKGGFVDLFLFSPDNKEQRLTFSNSNETKTVLLSPGRWDYNCTGFFSSGTITISGTVSKTGATIHGTEEMSSGTKDNNSAATENQTTAEGWDEAFYLASNGKNKIIKSGGFMAEDNQTLTITVQSDIKGGFVDLVLFSPDNKEQRLTFDDSNETKTVTLLPGRWDYNCTGFFDSGDMTIIGTIE